MEMKNAIKWFTTEIRRLVKSLDLYNYKELEVTLRDKRQDSGAGYLLTICFYKGNDIRTFAFPVDNKKVAIKLFDIAEKVCRKYIDV